MFLPKNFVARQDQYPGFVLSSLSAQLCLLPKLFLLFLCASESPSTTWSLPIDSNDWQDMPNWDCSSNSWMADCTGQCDGSAEVDECGVCEGTNDCDCPGYPQPWYPDCSGDCDGTLVS